jgi:hypothetical protein
MSETIFLLDTYGKLIELSETHYVSEHMLQKLLADYPGLLSGSQLNSIHPRRWLLISREFGVPDEPTIGSRWSLDHLFIDQDGIPTLVEVKRSTDTRIRREIVGQMLDYAANAVIYWTIEEIQYRFEEQCAITGTDSNITLENFLQGEITSDNFWELTRTNLKAGKIRMLFVADTIPKELQRIIEFLNEQMTPAEILGIEIKQFVGQDNFTTLVPRVIGQTTSAENVKGVIKGKNSHWDEDSFFTELSTNRGQEETQIARQLLEWLTPRVDRIWYGTGKHTGSLVPIFHHKNYVYQLFALRTDGFIEIYFQWYKGKPPFNEEQRRLELLYKLNQIQGVDIPSEKVSARPSVPLTVLLPANEYQKFTVIFQWFIDEVKGRTDSSL